MTLTEFKNGEAVWYPTVRKKRGSVRQLWMPAIVDDATNGVLKLKKPDGSVIVAASGVCKARNVND